MTIRELKRFELEVPEEENLYSGHSACAGCGGAIALRHVLKGMGKRVVIVTCACCMGTATGTAIKVASSHGPFGSVASWASGVKAGLEMQGDTETTVIGWAGDGGTFDIGLQPLSATAERNEAILFVCYDNEAYMMTGAQRSSATPMGAWTTTTPRIKPKFEAKKNIVEIMAAHRIPYAAKASIGYPKDLMNKLSKAKAIKGMRFLHIIAPCPTGWRYSPDLTVRLSRLAVESRIFPLYEVEQGLRYMVQVPPNQVPVAEYLKLQGRFSHLDEANIDILQKSVDWEWEHLLGKCESSEPLA
ncbi:thiamine pyrophosphate-dependent enzyme [Chloroflexota bacterium]